MKDFTFSIATTADDEEILTLLRDNPVPGKVSIAYERQPSYFIGCGVMGAFHQTVIARHRHSGRLAGLGCRAIKPMFINGQATDTGYLGQLRADRRFQARGLVTAGFRFLRELDEDQRTRGYITTIIEGNPVADAVLVRRRSASVPLYREIDQLYTLVLPARPYAASHDNTVETCPAAASDLQNMIAFLLCHGAQKQFFPVLSAEDFLPGSAQTRDLCLGDFLLAKQGGNICGVMGLWDQSAYKQPVIHGYTGLLRWGRPLYNCFVRCRGDKPLPPPGATFSVAYAAFTCVADNSPAIFEELLRRLCTTAARRGYGRILLGLTARDPLLDVARKHPHVLYVSRLYSACWRERSQFHDELDRRVSHIELATI